MTIVDVTPPAPIEVIVQVATTDVDVDPSPQVLIVALDALAVDVQPAAPLSVDVHPAAALTVEVAVDQQLTDVSLTVPGPRGVQGVQGDQGLQGVQGVQGDPGPPGPDATFWRHVQSTPASTWLVVHSLGYKPGGIYSENSAHEEIRGRVTHIDVNSLTLDFFAAGIPVAEAGEAYIS